MQNSHIDREVVYEALRLYLELRRKSELPTAQELVHTVDSIHPVDLVGLTDRLDEQLSCRTCYVYVGYLIEKRCDCLFIVLDADGVASAKRDAEQYRHTPYMPLLTFDTTVIGEVGKVIAVVATNRRKRHM